MAKTRHIIWSNCDVDYDSMIEDMKANEPELADESEDELLGRAIELNEFYLDDERANLNIHAPGDIVIIGDIGRWNGRVQGYKELKSSNIADCLYSSDDYIEWYVDGYGDLRATGHHHDGTNYYLYRAFKPGLTDAQKQHFLDKVYYGTVVRQDITRYTKRLGDHIAEVYGWKIRRVHGAA